MTTKRKGETLTDPTDREKKLIALLKTQEEALRVFEGILEAHMNQLDDLEHAAICSLVRELAEAHGAMCE